MWGKWPLGPGLPTLAENLAAAEAALWRGDAAAMLAAAQTAGRQALAGGPHFNGWRLPMSGRVGVPDVVQLPGGL